MNKAAPLQEATCNPHPDAPHGFARDASHSEGRYVCECEGWEPEAAQSQEYDINKCPGCGGEADNGHDREVPPNPYYCTKCEAAPSQEPVAYYEADSCGLVLATSWGGDGVVFPYEGNWQPLYTAPPDAAQIAELTKERDSYRIERDDLQRIHVEQASEAKDYVLRIRNLVKERDYYTQERDKWVVANTKQQEQIAKLEKKLNIAISTLTALRSDKFIDPLADALASQAIMRIHAIDEGRE